jgi:hypothetical protein
VWQALIKFGLTALVVFAASEVAKRNLVLGAVIGSLPLVSILAVTWLWRDTGDSTRVADYLSATLWLVLASLPLFVITPGLLRTGWSFWPALGIGALASVAAYGVTFLVLNKVTGGSV